MLGAEFKCWVGVANTGLEPAPVLEVLEVLFFRYFYFVRKNHGNIRNYKRLASKWSDHQN